MSTRPTKKLGEISQIKTGRKDANFGTPDGEYPFFTCGEKILKAPDYSFDTESILVAGNGDVGACKYYKGKFEAYQRTYVIDKFIDADPFYLFYYLDGFLGIKAKQEMLGSAIPYIKLGMLQNFEIPLPSLDIQKAIVTKLDEAFAEIDEAIALTEENISKAEEFKKSVLDRILEEGEYEKKSVKEISEKIQYGYTGKVVNKSIYRYLRITDIQNGNVQRETVPFCDIDDTEAKKYLLNEGDIVFARTGATVGKSFLIDKPGVGNVFASYLIRIVSDKKQIVPNFLLYFFQSNKYRDQIFGEVVGAAQPNFNGNKLGEIILPLPPLSKQAEIVSYLDQVFAETSALKSDYETKLTHLRELKASILQSAFEGKLIAE